MGVSNAVGSDRVGKVVGYEILKGNFLESTPNLPMSVAIFGQANTDKQSGLTNAKFQVTSEKEAGDKFGFGSQIHTQMRIIRNQLSDAMGGIPTIIYPQLEPSAGAAEEQTITITGGPATAAAVHKVEVNGRSNFDGPSLEISIASGDDVTAVAVKIVDAINAAPACPVSATNVAGVVTCVLKWKGENGSELDIVINVQDLAVGLVYVVAQTVAAAGDSSAEITTSLALFGNVWNTIIVNPYPITRDALFEVVNGVPGAVPASGRYAGEVFLPFVVLRGSTIADSVANVIASLDKDQATISTCAAPNSRGWDAEAAANVGLLLARQAQDSPHLDTAGKTYPDMPTPLNEDAGIYETYNNRDLIVKGGASTVIINNAKYEIQDQVTTYHPDNEVPPQFRYVRTLIQDWNVRFAYFLLEEINVVEHTLVENSAPIGVKGTIKPKQWVGILDRMFNDLTERAILVEPDFSTESLIVEISSTNPDRLETFFKYKRSGFARITSTTGEAGFNFG